MKGSRFCTFFVLASSGAFQYAPSVVIWPARGQESDREWQCRCYHCASLCQGTVKEHLIFLYFTTETKKLSRNKMPVSANIPMEKDHEAFWCSYAALALQSTTIFPAHDFGTAVCSLCLHFLFSCIWGEVMQAERLINANCWAVDMRQWCRCTSRMHGAVTMRCQAVENISPMVYKMDPFSVTFALFINFLSVFTLC